MSDEDFVEIKDYPNYRINKEGEVRKYKETAVNINRKHTIQIVTHTLKPHIHGGYQCVRINYESKPKQVAIHTLLAKTFIENPNNLKVVVHIDGDKLNNNLENLKWGTMSDIMKQAYVLGTIKTSPNIQTNQKKHNTKRVYVYDKNNILIKEFESVTQASKELLMSIVTISNRCTGRFSQDGMEIRLTYIKNNN